jgi:peptidoglycan/LPS O-acetylase OafA/YrhL
MRLRELDSLRGLAALVVVLFHYTTKYHQDYIHTSEPLINFSLGHYGVQLFFVVSGFVIFMTLERCKKPMDFIVSRFARLYPIYWVAVSLTFMALICFGLPDKTVTVSQYLVNLSMLQVHFNVKDIDGVYWTLAYELIFYFWMFCLFLSGKKDKIILFCGFWLGLQLFASLCETYLGSFPWKITFYLLLEYSNLFIAGILFYLIKKGGEKKIVHYLIFLCLFNQFIRYNLESFLVTSSIIGIFYLFVYDKLQFLDKIALVYLGSISYSIYLIHEYIGFIIIQRLELLGLETNLVIAMTVITVIAIAAFISHLVEQPLNKKIKSSWRNYKQRNAIKAASQ